MKIVIYETKFGKQPFSDWFDELSNTQMSKIYKRLLRVSAGNFGDSKSLGASLFELRFSDGIRIYYSKLDNILVLLLIGGNKNNKSEQSRDIAKAREYLADFWERKNGK